MSKYKKAQARKVFESWRPTDEQKLEQYIKLFPEQFQKVADSPRAKVKGLSESDLLAFGKTLEQQVMLPINEEVSFAQLGPMPTLSLDFITAMFGKSVIPYIASEQVIDDVKGLVYFENIVANTKRGNIEVGDVLGRAAGAPDAYPAGFAGEMVYGEECVNAATQTGGQDQAFSLQLTPIRRNYVKVMCDGKVATDDGKGNLIGSGIAGTINYDTGAVTVHFVTAPTSGQPIVADYATNFEMGELPTITTELSSKIVKASVFGLQTDTSVISQFVMAKRHNFDMQTRAVQILQEQILNEITTDLIRKIEAAYTEYALDLTQFNCTLPQGVSQQAHFNAADYAFGVVKQKMAKRAGTGILSVALAGADMCAFLEQLAKFKQVGEATAYATVYGVYDNRTIVIRCPQMVEADAAYFLYKGDTPFNAAAVYAPFMPLVGVQDLPVPTAMLNRRSAVASMAALDVLVPGYIQKFKITNAPTLA